MPPLKPQLSPIEILQTMTDAAEPGIMPKFANEEDTITMEDVLQSVQNAMAQAAVAEQNQDAGVAQTAERLPRKQETAGSTPAASSRLVCSNCNYEIERCESNPTGWTHKPTERGKKGVCFMSPVPKIMPEKTFCKNGHELAPSEWNKSGWTHERYPGADCDPVPVEEVKDINNKGMVESQRAIIAKIVHHRVAMDENQKAISENKASLAKEKIDYEKSVKAREQGIASWSSRAQFHLEQMIEAEEELRQSILSDVVVRGIPKEEAPPAVHDEPEDIGRAE